MSRVLIVSDFNTSNLAAILANDPREPVLEIVEAPFGQVFQVLSDESHEAWSQPIDALIVWTQPQRIITSFAKLVENESVAPKEIAAEVDQLAGLINLCRKRVKSILVSTWTLPPWERGIGLLERRRSLGLRDALARMNLQLAERLEADGPDGQRSNAFALDADRWIAQGGNRAFSIKAWYLGKIAFGNEVFKQACLDIKEALAAIGGRARKLVIVDLDDTLWGGIVGDTGWQNLVLGGHDGDGEALVDFQRALKGLTRRGILLGIVSKNEESVALEAIRSHPEMALVEKDFSAWRINWSDKAQNVADLATELNLGLQSVVFIDDNPAERARVAEMLPEVLVPDWPKDKTLYRKALLELGCFDTPTLTEEDRARAALYAADQQRKSTQSEVGSLDDWLGSLGIVAQIEPLSRANLARANQLLNKTNQMNLSTRRLTEQEFLDWSDQESNSVWTVRVKDKFGELGLTGLLSVARTGNVGQIVDFVLSCRVMGRKIEEALLAKAIEHAREKNIALVSAAYLPTEKNKPCQAFFLRSGMHCSEDNTHFEWNVSQPFDYPVQVARE